MRSLTVATGPASEPITTAEAKTHLRVDHTDDDTFIGTLIEAARERLEGFTGRALFTQTLHLWLDQWPTGTIIRLPRPPLTSVTSITYYDTNDLASTFSADDYHVDTDAEPGRIILADGATWPADTLRPAHAIKIIYVAGYADAGAVPEKYKNLLKLMVGQMYEHREPVITGTISTELPLVWRHMIGERFLDTLVDC